MSSPDLKSKYFFFGNSDSPNLADRIVNGPCHLYGVILWYKNLHTSTDDVAGTFRIRNGVADGTGDVLFEVPVVTFENYGTCEFLSFSDSDGYIRFDDGMYLDQTNSGTETIFTGFAITVLYGGAS
jgi:hypothetical protein